MFSAIYARRRKMSPSSPFGGPVQYFYCINHIACTVKEFQLFFNCRTCLHPHLSSQGPGDDLAARFPFFSKVYRVPTKPSFGKACKQTAIPPANFLAAAVALGAFVAFWLKVDILWVVLAGAVLPALLLWKLVDAAAHGRSKPDRNAHCAQPAGIH